MLTAKSRFHAEKRSLFELTCENTGFLNCEFRNAAGRTISKFILPVLLAFENFIIRVLLALKI